MQVLLTVGLFVALGVWCFIVTRKLARLREEVKLAWKRLEHDRANDAVMLVYNKHVAAYNAALAEFPANVIAPLSGFKPARPFRAPNA